MCYLEMHAYGIGAPMGRSILDCFSYKHLIENRSMLDEQTHGPLLKGFNLWWSPHSNYDEPKWLTFHNQRVLQWSGSACHITRSGNHRRHSYQSLFKLGDRIPDLGPRFSNEILQFHKFCETFYFSFPQLRYLCLHNFACRSYMFN